MNENSEAQASKRGQIIGLLSVLLLLGLIIGGIRIQEQFAALVAENDSLKKQAQSPTTERSAAPDVDKAKELESPRRSLANPVSLKKPATDSESPFLIEARERAETDPEAAMLWLQEQTLGSDRLQGMLEVVAIWAAKDSESALLWLESNAQGLARLQTLNSGVELWATKDPRAAASWIDGMANDGSKISAAKSLASTWVKSSSGEASQWVSSLPPGSIRDEAARALAKSWVEEDPQAASIWAFEQSNLNGDKDLKVETIQSFTRQSPAEAEAFLRQIDEVDYDPAILEKHVLARAEEDPTSTAQWFVQLSEADPIYSAEYANPILYTWTETDSIAASAWLSEQALGPERDAAIVGFAESIQRFEPAAAVTWANTISDPNRRVQQITSSLEKWAKTQPEAALDWVINSELEPALQEQLARQIGIE